MTPCLDENVLLELTEGTLDEQALAQVELHVDGCDRCRQLVAALIRVDAPPGASSFRRVDPSQYEATRELARGGMGRIRLARDQHLDRDVALKEMLPGATDRRRFEREARLTARLQHPSIVKVLAAGRWPSGEPFYAMPHVRGRSLEKVIAEAPTLELRLALLPHVIAVADAMASAHAEGIIHRDVKPSNVLVGSFGETVVIDWGLAKDLRAPPEPDEPVANGPRTADQTDAGTVVGTPAYMPPEQALGQPVDARADVYALGAMLDHLLSGRRAYGGDGLDTLEQVKRGPPPPLATRAPGAPGELVAIAERAMARAPEARYASAQEFAADLRRYLTGQLVGAHPYSFGQLLRRWVRRHRVEVGVTAVAVLVSVVLGAVALSRVVRAEQRAQQSRAKTEDLLDFILKDLHGKLATLGRLDLMEDAAQRAVRRSDSTEADASATELVRASLARQHLGEVFAAQGKLDLALNELHRAVELGERAAAFPGGTDTPALTLAAARIALGKVLESRGERPLAEAEFRHALDLQQALAARATDDARVLTSLAETHEYLGNSVFKANQVDAALVEYRKALELREAAAATAPAEPDRQNALAKARSLVADVLQDLGRNDEALTIYQSAREVTSALVQANPQNVKFRQTLARQNERLGDLLLAVGRPGAAGEAFERSRALNQALVEQDGSNLEWLHDLAYAHDGLGDVLRATSTPAAALEHYRKAEVLRSRIAVLDPSNAWRQRDLSMSLELLGETLSLLGDQQGALAQFEQSLVVRQALVATDPTNDLWAHDVMASRDHLGSTLIALRQLDRAAAQYEQEHGFCRSVFEHAPTSTEARSDLVTSVLNLGDLAHARGDEQAALGRYAEALALIPAPTTDDWRQQRSQIFEKQGQSLLALGDRRKAHAAFEQALANDEAWARTRPEDPVARRRLEQSSHTLRTCCRVP